MSRFDQNMKTAGNESFSDFMKHPKLSLQHPESTSLARASWFNKVVVHKFFDVLEHLIVENRINAARMFNMDKISHTAVQHPENITAQKGTHQLGGITFLE
jgi:hypothetical protein